MADEISKTIYNCLDLFRCVPDSLSVGEDEMIEDFGIVIDKKAHWCRHEIITWLSNNGLELNIYKLIDSTSEKKVIDACDEEVITEKCLQLQQHNKKLSDTTIKKLIHLLHWCEYKSKHTENINKALSSLNSVIASRYQKRCAEIFELLYQSSNTFNGTLTAMIESGSYEIPPLSTEEVKQLATNYYEYKYLWIAFKNVNPKNVSVCNRVRNLSKKMRKQAFKQKKLQFNTD